MFSFVQSIPFIYTPENGKTNTVKKKNNNHHLPDVEALWQAAIRCTGFSWAREEKSIWFLFDVRCIDFLNRLARWCLDKFSTASLIQFTWCHSWLHPLLGVAPRCIKKKCILQSKMYLSINSINHLLHIRRTWCTGRINPKLTLLLTTPHLSKTRYILTC